MKNAPDPLQDPRFADLRARLRGQPAPEPSPGFSARTMERLRQRPEPRSTRLVFAWRAAAAFAILFGVAGLWRIHPASMPAPRPRSPVEILMSAQRADGGWSADEQNLRSRYDTGVTALALLALIHADPAILDGSRAFVLRSGMAHLLRQQNPDGGFGEDYSGARFTHYLAGMALQAGARLPNADPAWGSAAERAARHLPPAIHMAKLNNRLAHSAAFPSRWADAGGPAAQIAIQILTK
ncbi:MAG: hypothetical protein EOM72_04860 [Opitutae bacterium]|nr:hypothetical protein [Opitutae bacterium]